MKYLEIKNKGLIEPEALTLLGGTTKTNDDSKIGMFGSGNKYALAYFMRNNIGLKIFSGLEEIKIDTVKKVFRGEEMNVITVNGSETSITDKTGPGWDLWQCIREIYSNAVDEGILSFDLVDEITPDNNVSSFYLEATPDIIKFYQNRELYFYSEGRVIFECEHGRILKKIGNSANIYRRGIRCYETTQNSLYDYDLFNIRINESRIIMDEWLMKQSIWALHWANNDSDVALNFIANHTKRSEGRTFIENNYYLNYIDSTSYPACIGKNNVFDEILKDKYICPEELGGYVDSIFRDNTYFIEKTFYKFLIKTFGTEISALNGANGDNIKYRVKEPTPLEKRTIDQALDFFNSCEFIIDYPVFVVDFLIDKKENLMGLAHDGNILISSYCIEKGVQYTVDCILEEMMHLKHNVGDETRAMQNALISEMINYMKFKNAIVI